jgi:transposase
LGNWVAKDRVEREGTQGLSTEDVEELKRVRAEVAELRMERDVLPGRMASVHKLLPRLGL